MMKRNASVLSLMMVGATLVAGNVARAADEPALKVGVVDMQKALQSVEAGKKAKTQLEKEFNAKKKELQGEEASIKKMGEEFKKQAAVMNDDARAKKQGELQERIMKFQESTARSQAELQQKERDLTGPIIGKLRTVIADTAKQRGVTLVLEKNENTVLYAIDKYDMTSDVVSAFNKSGAVASSGSKSKNAAGTVAPGQGQ